MQRSFEETIWFKEKGLTLLQAFSLCAPGVSGVRLELTQEEIAQLRGWADQKAAAWGKRSTSILQDLVMITKADPDLVRQVRIGKGGGHGEGKGMINPARLKAIVNNLSDKNLQLKVGEAVVWADLDARNTDLLAQAIAAFQDESETVEIICSQVDIVTKILGIIPDGWDKMPILKELLVVSAYHDLKDFETIELAKAVVMIGDNAEKKDSLYENPRGFFCDYQSSLQIQEEHIIPLQRRQNISPLDAPFLKADDLDNEAGYVKPPTPDELQQQIDKLTEALSEMSKSKGTGKPPWLSKRRKRKWWKEIPDLTLDERLALEYVIQNKFSLERAAAEMKITQNQVMILIKAGLTRYFKSVQDSFEDWYDSVIPPN